MFFCSKNGKKLLVKLFCNKTLGGRAHVYGLKEVVGVVCLQILESDGEIVLFCTLICDGVMFVLLPNC